MGSWPGLWSLCWITQSICCLSCQGFAFFNDIFAQRYSQWWQHVACTYPLRRLYVSTILMHNSMQSQWKLYVGLQTWPENKPWHVTNREQSILIRTSVTGSVLERQGEGRRGKWTEMGTVGRKYQSLQLR
jgi:hypothetical protein